MSIQSEIEDLRTNLAAAKAAIVAAGGVVGDTGLAGVAAEIGSISGGGGDDPGEYGLLYYHPYSIQLGADQVWNCTVTGMNEERYRAWCSSQALDADQPIEFMYSSYMGFWEARQGYDMMHGIEIYESDMWPVVGIRVSDYATPQGDGSFRIKKMIVTDDTQTLSVQLANSTDYNALCNNTDTYDTIASISGTQIPFAAMTKFVFGTGITAIPNNFLRWSNVEEVSSSDAILTIGDLVLYYCPRLDCPISFPNATTIGAAFLGCDAIFNSSVSVPSATTIGKGFLRASAGEKAFNQTIDISSAVTIGEGFLDGQSQFNQPLTIPASCTSLGYILYGCDSMTNTVTCNSLPTFTSTSYMNWYFGVNQNSPAQLQGMKLTGPYAQTWKNTFPDSTSSWPLRTLIVV